MNTDKDINNMKMWVFRLAQTRWEKTSEQCARIFKDNGLYKVISDGSYVHDEFSGFCWASVLRMRATIPVPYLQTENVL